ncbi:permease-like cell division protein FtsX [Spirillospora sp. NBC_00431]
MSGPEDRLTDALKGVGETVRPGDVPPAPFPDRPPAAVRRPLVMGAVIAAFVVVMGGMIAGGYVAVDRTLGDRGEPSAASAERQVSVFLCIKASSKESCDGEDATEAQKQAIKRRLEAMPQVKRVTYESKRQAYERFKKHFRENENLVESTREGDIPDSFRARVANASDAKAVMRALLGSPGVDTVVVDPRRPGA